MSLPVVAPVASRSCSLSLTGRSGHGFASKRISTAVRPCSARARCEKYRSSDAVQRPISLSMAAPCPRRASRAASPRSSAGVPHDVVAVTDGPSAVAAADNRHAPNS